MPGQHGSRGTSPDATLHRKQREPFRAIVVFRLLPNRPPVSTGDQTISQIHALPDFQGRFQGLQQGVVHEQHGSRRFVAVRPQILVQEASQPLKGILAGPICFDPFGCRYAHPARQVPHQVHPADAVRNRTPSFDRADDAGVHGIECNEVVHSKPFCLADSTMFPTASAAFRCVSTSVFLQ